MIIGVEGLEERGMLALLGRPFGRRGVAAQAKPLRDERA
jgi:hypothetical protein